MKLTDLQSKFRHRPLFRLSGLHPTQPHAKHELVQLNHWVKQGLVIRIARGVYTLPEDERAVPLDPLWLANDLYAPSYISTHYALAYHGLIPEAVGTVTSLSTRKTARFQTPLGTYFYHHIRKSGFFGFTTVKPRAGTQQFWMALPEKAVLDFVHLCVPTDSPCSFELFTEGYRLQNLEILDSSVFSSMVDRFYARNINRHVRVFMELLDTRNAHA